MTTLPLFVDECAETLDDEPGILQSSKTSSAVLDPLMPSLSSFWAVEKPGIPFKKKEEERKKNIKPFRRATTSHCQKTAAWPLIYLFHNESCDASLIGVGVGLCVDNEDVGVRPVCDPELVSVQDVVVAWRRKRHTTSDFRDDLSSISLPSVVFLVYFGKLVVV